MLQAVSWHVTQVSKLLSYLLPTDGSWHEASLVFLSL